ETEGSLSPFVIDLRNREVVPALAQILQLPVRFVGHFTKVELFCLWQLGLTEPRWLWDTWVHEKAQHLGRNHVKYVLSETADVVEEARAKEDAEEHESATNSLVATCQRYGVAYAMEGAKKRLQASV